MSPIYCDTNAFTCSFEVENFNVTTEKILAHGGQVDMERYSSQQVLAGLFHQSKYNTFGLLQVGAYA